jgi:hypothetical protein
LARQLRYRGKLRARIRDPHLWPGAEKASHLNELTRAATRAYRRRTVDGALAAILIYHQLTDEMVRVLLADTRFFIQLSVFPQEINFSAEDGRLTFGRRLGNLAESLDFPMKTRFLKLAAEMNTIRNAVAHGLTKRGHLVGLSREARRAQNLFVRLFDLYDDADDWFRLSFKDFRKDMFWP